MVKFCRPLGIISQSATVAQTVPKFQHKLGSVQPKLNDPCLPKDQPLVLPVGAKQEGLNRSSEGPVLAGGWERKSILTRASKS